MAMQDDLKRRVARLEVLLMGLLLADAADAPERDEMFWLLRRALERGGPRWEGLELDDLLHRLRGVPKQAERLLEVEHAVAELRAESQRVSAAVASMPAAASGESSVRDDLYTFLNASGIGLDYRELQAKRIVALRV